MSLSTIRSENRAVLALLFNRAFFSDDLISDRVTAALGITEYGRIEPGLVRFIYDYIKGRCLGVFIDDTEHISLPLNGLIKKHEGSLLYEGVAIDGGSALQITSSVDAVLEVGVHAMGAMYTPYVKFGEVELRSAITTTANVRFVVSFSETGATIYVDEQDAGSIVLAKKTSDFKDLFFGNKGMIHGRVVYWPAPLVDAELFSSVPEAISSLFSSVLEWDMNDPSPDLTIPIVAPKGVEWDMANTSPLLTPLL